MSGIRDRRLVYFSLRSPYSWLAWRDINAYFPDLLSVARWIPFWEPDPETERRLEAAGGRFSYAEMSRDKHLYVLQDMRRQSRERGVAFQWPVDRAPRWEVPHAAYLLAARSGLGFAFLDAVSRARWEQGRDICDPATVRDVAAEIGADPAALAGAADRPDVRDEGVEALLRAFRDGVFGVPFFINGFEKFWGVERLVQFVGSLDGTGRRDPRPEPDPALAAATAPATAGADGGHAGGCG